MAQDHNGVSLKGTGLVGRRGLFFFEPSQHICLRSAAVTSLAVGKLWRVDFASTALTHWNLEITDLLVLN